MMSKPTHPSLDLRKTTTRNWKQLGVACTCTLVHLVQLSANFSFYHTEHSPSKMDPHPSNLTSEMDPCMSSISMAVQFWCDIAPAIFCVRYTQSSNAWLPYPLKYPVASFPVLELAYLCVCVLHVCVCVGGRQSQRGWQSTNFYLLSLHLKNDVT